MMVSTAVGCVQQGYSTGKGLPLRTYLPVSPCWGAGARGDERIRFHLPGIGNCCRRSQRPMTFTSRGFYSATAQYFFFYCSTRQLRSATLFVARFFEIKRKTHQATVSWCSSIWLINRHISTTRTRRLIYKTAPHRF